MLGKLIPMVLVVFVWGGCGSEGGDGPVADAEGACVSSETCLDGLVCVSGACVSDEGDAEASPDADAVEIPQTDAGSDVGPIVGDDVTQSADVEPEDVSVCEAGTVTCVDDTVMTCDADGQWSETETCQASQVCVDGACCQTTCEGKACGDNGCGGVCGVCDDGFSCTEDTCSAEGQCVFEPVTGPGCCTADADCDDGSDCTTDACDVASNACVLEAIPGCCAEDADCEDGLTCTVDACEMDVMLCSHTLTPDCCDPATVCEADTCPPDACPESPSWLPEGLSILGECLLGSGDCSFRANDDAEVLDAIQRIYKGASVYYQSPYLDKAGAVLPHQFPTNQGVTPIEGTCCSEGALSYGPDTNDNNLCDWSPYTWNTDTWSALAFNIHGNPWNKECGTGYGTATTGPPEGCVDTEHAYVYDFSSEGTQEASTFTARATRHVGCDECLAAEVSVTASVDPAWTAGTLLGGQNVCSAGCGLLAPESLDVTLPTDCEDGVITGHVVLTEAQRPGFLPPEGVKSLHPHWDELTANMDAIIQGAIDAFEASDPASCSFPSNQGVTPIEGTCCSSTGLPGPDADGDDLCDLDAGTWQTSTWNALDFQPADDHIFVYKIESSGAGPDASFTVTANADIDCDGIQSTFQRMISLSPLPNKPSGLPEGLVDGACSPPGGADAWSAAALSPYYMDKGIE